MVDPQSELLAIATGMAPSPRVIPSPESRLLADAVRILQDHLWAPDGKVACHYLTHSRAIPESIARAYSVGYLPASSDEAGGSMLSDELRALGHSDDVMLSVGIAVRNYDRKGLCDKPRGGGYIALPLTDPSGQVIGIKYRAVTGEASEDARRFDATSSALSGAMFGFDRLPVDAHTVIAVEGEIDQLSLAAARECDPSLPPAVAWHGKELSGERLALLSSRAKHVVLMLDADEGGFDGILRGGRKLARAGVAISVVRMPADVDANELLRAGDAPGLARAVHNLPRVSLFEEHARVFTRFGPAHVNIASSDPYFVASELRDTAEALACIELEPDAVERGAKLVNLDPGLFAKYVAAARENELACAAATNPSPRVADYDVTQLLESAVDVEGEDHDELVSNDAGGL